MLGDVPCIEAPHPSPAVGAARGFFGSRPFSRANDLLAPAGRRPDRLEAAMTQPAPRSPSRGRGPATSPIGDSFTEGMCDPDPQLARTRYVGWADRLAAHLRDRRPGERLRLRQPRRARAAARRRRRAAARRRPRAAARTWSASSAAATTSCAPRPTSTALAAELEAAVARIRATGADVLMATPVDPQDAPLVRHTRGRAAIYTAHIWTIARRHGAFVIDQWGMTALRDWRMWARRPDPHDRRGPPAGRARRLHQPSASPPTTPTGRRRCPRRRRSRAARGTVRANAQWAREYVGPWVQRRLRGQSSGDALSAKRPNLLPPVRPQA